jgi:hypothetical protein
LKTLLAPGLILITVASLITGTRSQLLLSAVAVIGAGLITQLILSAFLGLVAFQRAQLVLSALARLQAILSPELDLVLGSVATAGAVSQSELVLSAVAGANAGPGATPLSARSGARRVGCNYYRYRKSGYHSQCHGHDLEVHDVTSFPFCSSLSGFLQQGYGSVLEILWRTDGLVVWFAAMAEPPTLWASASKPETKSQRVIDSMAWIAWQVKCILLVLKSIPENRHLTGRLSVRRGNRH